MLQIPSMICSGRRVGEHRLPDEVVHDGRREHRGKILQVDEIEDALNLSRPIARSTSRIGRQMLEGHRAIVRVFAEKLCRLYRKKLVWMPPLVAIEGLVFPPYNIAARLRTAAISARVDVNSSFAQSDLTRRARPDGFHGAGTMDPIEDRLVIADLFDEPRERVFGHDRRRRVVRVPDIEIFSRPEIDVVAMGHRHIGLRVRGCPRGRSVHP